MITPVTSTRVATNGAEETAGSAPNLLSTMGNMEPEMVPNMTTPIRETPTTMAKGMNSKKAEKKEPAKTPKEKKEEKREKKKAGYQ